LLQFVKFNEISRCLSDMPHATAFNLSPVATEISSYIPFAIAIAFAIRICEFVLICSR